MNKHHDGLYSKICDINLEKLKDSALQINEMISVHCKSDPKWDFAAKCATYSEVFEQYNLLMYPLPEFHKLFDHIKTFFYECQIREFGKPLSINYYLQSWVNVYRYGEFIDWHSHGRTATYAWHGFFCVDTEPSKTSYRYIDETIPFDIESKDGLLVLGKSNTDFHRTYPWTNADKPRITIAFDIVPQSTIMRLNGSNDGETRLVDMLHEYPYFKNHWIPI